MKKILIITTALIVSLAIISLGVICFIGNSKVDNNTNEQREKQARQM